MAVKVRRVWIDRALERFHFELDRRPALEYQPMPWLGIDSARRDAGTRSRWEAFRPRLDALGVRTIVDVGCNVGYYPISLGFEGFAAVGVEPNPKMFRLFRYAIHRLGLEGVGALDLAITPDTVRMLPTGDLMIFLSVWHHLVRAHGLEEATRLLEVIWARTERGMLFETGETEIPDRYGLPDFGDDPAGWIKEFLERHCVGSAVEHLGQHDAFDPKGRPCRRNLFLVTRAASAQE
jgi:SAM-dependent methyltransferase